MIYAGKMEDILRPIENFIDNLGNPHAQDTVLVTLMAVSFNSKASDNPAFQSFISSEIERFRGRSSENDSCSSLAGFDGTGRAIRCALAVRDYCLTHTLPCRIGLHVGECQRSGDVLSGDPVTTSRAIALSTPTGEIMATGMVKDIVTGVDFDDGQPATFSDIDGEWILFKIRG